MSRTLLACVLLAGALLAVRTAAQPGSTASPGPWQAARCYRVFLGIDDAPHLLRILDTAGDWVRVAPDPASPRVPGSDQRAPM